MDSNFRCILRGNDHDQGAIEMPKLLFLLMILLSIFAIPVFGTTQRIVLAEEFTATW